MQLQPIVDQVLAQLRAAAALGDERTRQVAEALAAAAEAAVRLAVLDAVTRAAGEITSTLFADGIPGSVTAQLNGDDIDVQVIMPREAPAAEPSQPADGEPTARISLRLPETLKAEIDRAAEREGVSVNSWLIRAAQRALSLPHGSWATGWPSGFGYGAQRISGWVEG
ncbi:MAG: ribbon-helix-helix domain-containing protein [Acidothermus cellulolyticus]|nr:ribbon-helix-helix domain-containing protein [Acidothermus cellulolyticus]